MINLPIYNYEGKEVDTVKLDPKVFDGVVNSAVLHQAINAFRANQRKGLAATKTRGEVSGGGRKPWKQKGTGRARVGSTRSPLWRHGGVIFGPHPRDFSYLLPNKIKKAALKSALSSKINENKVMVIDSIKLENSKTKEALKIFAKLNVGLQDKRVLLLLEKSDENLKRALRNLSFLEVNLARLTNAYEVLAAHKLIITKDALKGLMARI